MSLEIPTSLKYYLKERYVTDKYFCQDVLPPLLPEEFGIQFEQPYMKLTNDEWLTIQNWTAGIPEWVFEVTHLKVVYYSIDNEDKRLCYNCLIQRMKNKPENELWHVFRQRYCDTEYGGELMERLQDPGLWCDWCMTTSLFFLEEWDNRVRHVCVSFQHDVAAVHE